MLTQGMAVQQWNVSVPERGYAKYHVAGKVKHCMVDKTKVHRRVSDPVRVHN
jgi:hypothetical protein